MDEPLSSFRALVSLHPSHHNKTRASSTSGRDDGYQAARISLDDLTNHVSSGRAWVACQLRDGWRHNSAAGDSNLIVLDIDGDLSLEEFWDIGFVQKHCCFTYTSASHRKATDKNPEARDRFRAVFRTRETLDTSLHRHAYWQLLDHAGLELADNSGQEDTRLWYGYDQTEVTHGEGEPLGWDLLAAAEDALLAEREARARPRPQLDDTELELDERRIATVLELGLIRPSEDGEYDYWVSVLNAAAASGSERIRDAFFLWHGGCHHSKTQKRVEQRYDKSGQRSIPGKILSFAKEQQGPDWWKLLPEDLWYKGGGQEPPQVLYSAGSYTPPEVTIGDIAPHLMPEPPGDGIDSEERALLNSRINEAKRSLITPPADAKDRSYQDEATDQRQIQVGSLEDLLLRLYRLRAHGLMLDEQTLQFLTAPAKLVKSLDRALLSAILENRSYVGSPQEVDRDLLDLFRQEHGMQLVSNGAGVTKKLRGTGGAVVRWLIPGWIMAGQDHILVSKAGTGKTYLALHLARVLTGDPSVNTFLDQPLSDAHHKRWGNSSVLFIASDMGFAAEENTEEYIRKLDHTNEDYLERVDFFLADQKRSIPPWTMSLPGLLRLHRHLEAQRQAGQPVSAVIIDAMKSVCPGDLLVGHQAFRSFIELVSDLCRHHGAAVIWLHHTSRSNDGTVQGIARITEGTSAVFLMEKMSDAPGVKLEIQKIRGGASARTLHINPFEPGMARLMADLSGPQPSGAFEDDDDGNPDGTLVNYPANHPDHPVRVAVLRILREDAERHIAQNPNASKLDLALSYRGLAPREIRMRLPDSLRGMAERTFRRLLDTTVEGSQLDTVGFKRNTTYRIPLDLV